MRRIDITAARRVVPGDSFAPDSYFFIASDDQPQQDTALLTLETAFTTRGFAIVADHASDFSWVWVKTGGAITVTDDPAQGAAPRTLGYEGLGPNGPSFQNDGAITITSAAGQAVGATSFADGAVWRNNGAVAVQGRGEAWGVDLHNSQVFINTGTVDVYSQTGIAHGVSMSGERASFLNTGTIRAHDETPGLLGEDNDPRNSVAVTYDASTFAHGAWGFGFENRGLIEGDVAIRAMGPNTPAWINYQVSFWNTETGVIRGLVDFGQASTDFRNDGLVVGDVFLGDNADIYSTAGQGRVVGMISGGTGNDWLMGGRVFDYLQGNQGDDTITGGDGDDWVVGGKDFDHLQGEAGDDIVYGNLGDDDCDGGAGADLVRGGQGHDVITGGDGNDWLSGDRGDDTITGGAGADIFHSFGDAGVDRVLDFSAAQGDRVQLDPGSSYTVAQVGADTVISIVGGAKVILVGVQASGLPSGWIFGA